MSNPPPKHPRGLALVEILICSSIAAMMLTATALAFRSGIQSYHDNTERNMMVTSGRTALRQIIQEIRTSDAHGPVNDVSLPNATTLFASGQTIECSGMQMLKRMPDIDDPQIIPANPSTWVTLTYTYNSTTKEITKTRQIGVQTPTSMVAASYVQSFLVRMEPTRSAANIAAGDTSFDILLRAVVTLQLANRDAAGKLLNNQGSGSTSLRLIDAAMPRKNFAGL